MANFQNRPAETNLYLTLAGVPATGILFSAVTVKYRKFGQTALTTLTLTSPMWVEIGTGFYVLIWPAAVLNVLGDFFFTVTGAAFDNIVYGEFDVDPVPLPLTVPPDVCIISGNIIDIGGRPGIGQSIIVRPGGFPMGDAGSIVAADAVRTIPDALGNFQVALLQGKSVVISIERAAVHNTITVPMAPTANLTDLLPPFPN